MGRSVRDRGRICWFKPAPAWWRKPGNTACGPSPIGNSGIDQHGAAVLALGVVGAYVRKMKTGEGTRVEGSLYTACLDFMQEGLTHYYSGHQDRSVLARDPHLASWYIEAPYGTYELKDGFIVVSLNPFDKLARALDSERLAALAEGDAWRDRDNLRARLRRSARGVHVRGSPDALRRARDLV